MCYVFDARRERLDKGSVQSTESVHTIVRPEESHDALIFSPRLEIRKKLCAII